MKYRIAVSLTLVFSLFTIGLGQTPVPDEQEGVVRITTNLVQVDVIVTDKDGRHVTDLQPSDFELYEDGRPQPITHFSYITTQAGGNASSVAANPTPSHAKDKTKGEIPIPLPPAQLRRE